MGLAPAYRRAMLYTPRVLDALNGSFRILKSPAVDAPAAQRDPKVIATVSEMLSTIERDGLDAVLRYAADLDGWDGSDVSSPRTGSHAAATRCPPDCGRRSSSAPSGPGRSPTRSARA